MASPCWEGGGGQGCPVTQLGPAPAVAAPPAPAHVMLVLALVPLAIPDTHRSGVRLPSGWWGAGGEASPCQLLRGRGWSSAGAAGGRLLRAVICIRGGCGACGVHSWPRSQGERVSGPAGNGAGEILRSLSVSLSVFYQSRLRGCGVPNATVCAHLKPVNIALEDFHKVS